MPHKHPFHPLTLAIGTYRMRNGHLAEITREIEAKYDNPPRRYILWAGRCVDCNAPLSWLGIGNGLYAWNGNHPYDLVELIAIGETGQVAA